MVKSLFFLLKQRNMLGELLGVGEVWEEGAL